VGWMSGTRWEQIELPPALSWTHFVYSQRRSSYLHPRNVVTIHDAAVVASPAGYSPAYRLWHGNLCRRMARKAEHIFTVSNFSKSEIVKWYRAAAEKISVTYLGSDHFSSLEADPSARARFGISGKYVLAAGVQTLTRISTALCKQFVTINTSGIPLVIAGGCDGNVYRKSMRLPMVFAHWDM